MFAMPAYFSRMNRYDCSRWIVILAGGLLATGCAITPEPLSNSDVRARVNADQFKIYNDQEQVFRPISFNQALARALKYNLDYRLKLMETALATGLADVAKFDMLPNLVASAGYSSRNNDSGGTSIGIQTGVVSLIPSTSVERRHGTHGVELSWNILDFGVSYFRAQQQADQVLVAEERRRRVVQNILQDVRSAYWRAVGAQRLARDSERLSERVNTALERSREAEAQGLVSPRDALTFQRLLLDAVQLLAARKQELEFAKRELAALMNLTPGTEFTLVEEDERELMPVPVNVAELEELALLNRPELREEDYRTRITANEAKRQLASLLPGLSFNIAAQSDSNRYLYNRSWLESSTRVTFNMLRALSLPALNRSQAAQQQTDEARRLALTMAVLTQVRVAIERYRLTLGELEVARESTLVDQRLATYARAALSTRAEAELDLIRAETRALNSEYQRYAVYASAQAAFGRILNSLGLDVVPPGLESASVEKLGDAVAANLSQMENDTFVKITVTPPRLPPLSISFEGVQSADLSPPSNTYDLKLEQKLGPGFQLEAVPVSVDATTRELITATVTRALQRNRLAIGAAEGSHRLALRLLVDNPRNGVRRAQWVLSLLTPDSRVLGESRYASFLASSPSPASIAAFAEAATISNLRNYQTWLQNTGTTTQ